MSPGKVLLGLVAILPCLCFAGPSVIVDTSKGSFVIELDADKAPATVANFLAYVDEAAFDGTIFHRVIPGFMIQGGGHLPDMSELPAKDPVVNEAENGLSNLTGTIAMARTDEIDSAGRQFFINVNDNVRLDHTSESCTREQVKVAAEAQERGLYKPLSCTSYGYTVFGKVTSGMEVVHAIALVQTRTHISGNRDVPVEPVLINSVKRVKDDK